VVHLAALAEVRVQCSACAAHREHFHQLQTTPAQLCMSLCTGSGLMCASFIDSASTCTRGRLRVLAALNRRPLPAHRVPCLQELAAEAGDGGAVPLLLSQASLERALMARLR
jgi:hypothetical protein